MDKTNAIWRAMQALGNTPGDVAATLFDRGIRGFKSCTRGCPLAVYLHVIGYEGYSISRKWVHDGHGEFAEVLPTACVAFVDAFDGGRFDYLVSRETSV